MGKIIGLSPKAKHFFHHKKVFDFVVSAFPKKEDGELVKEKGGVYVLSSIKII